MSTNYRISTFIMLGEQLSNALRVGTLKPILEKATEENAWFTQASIRTAIQAICENMLQPEALNRWLAKYPIPNCFAPKNVGVVMAGNIPLVGFFDLVCVCICGHRCRVKYSSKDRVLMEWIAGRLQSYGGKLFWKVQFCWRNVLFLFFVAGIMEKNGFFSVP